MPVFLADSTVHLHGKICLSHYPKIKKNKDPIPPRGNRSAIHSEGSSCSTVKVVPSRRAELLPTSSHARVAAVLRAPPYTGENAVHLLRSVPVQFPAVSPWFQHLLMSSGYGAVGYRGYSSA